MEMVLAEITRLVGGELIGNNRKMISGAAAFDDADDHQITLAYRPSFLKRIDQSKAGAVIVPGHFRTEGKNLVAVDSPAVAFTKVVRSFFPVRNPGVGIDPTASVGHDFSFGDDLWLGPCAVIQDKVRCGHRVTIHAGVVV